MSYTSTQLLHVPTNGGSNVAIYNLCYAIDAAIRGSGFAQTSDTGQVSFSGAGSWSGGYRIYKFTDTLQTTAPFFIKVTYPNVTSGDITLPGFGFATSTDGAGNLTGNSTSFVWIRSGDPSGGVPQNCYFSGDTNRFAMVLFSGPTIADEWAVGWERTKNASAADTAAGLIILANTGIGAESYNNTHIFAQMLAATASTSDQGPLEYWPAATNQQEPSMQFNTTIGVAYPTPFNVFAYHPGLNFLLYQGTDFPAYAPQSLTTYDGETHNYIPMSANGTDPTLVTNQAHMLMRYE